MGRPCARGSVNSLAAAGLPDPEVRVDVVAELPRDGRSGKLRRFVPVG